MDLRASGAGHLAGGIEGPVAVEPDHAPLHAPARADEAGILADRIMHRPLAAITDQGDGATESARDRVGCPGPERGFTHLLEIDENVVFILVPSPFTTAMIATEMPAAISPYSIAVAPLSLARKARIFSRMTFIRI